ncbi:MAG: hypothetical protein ACOC80_13710 [Petrotogales bacterium]
MRIGDILYFSPKYKFVDLKWDNKEVLIDAFQDRTSEFYLKPAEVLNNGKHAFAAGIMCVTTIDFLAKIENNLDKVRERFENWLKSNIKQFDKPDPDNTSQTLARRFYEEFRNGLVHEGRIKNAGQFSYDYQELVKVKHPVIIVNPEHLLTAIDSSFKEYVDKVEKKEFTFQAFRCALIRDFQKDVEIANR